METLGHPVPLLIFEPKTKSYNLNSDTINNILDHEDVRDCNIAVISCAGAFRKGKSFLLNFFIRYLNEVCVKKNAGDWLEQQDEPLLGFSWKGGFERETTGIWIWSKIFTYQIPNGENVGVMLMDTQGTFDSETSTKDNITIFALSTMLSSVQIFNLFDMINECDLQCLQLFTEYGKLALEETKEKPFQHLLFLIRDWRFSKEYGFDGGQKYFNKIFEIENKPKEMVEVREHLKSCFQELAIFLMPNPGPIATKEEDFNGKVSDLDKQFIDYLKIFVPAILEPQNLVVKTINAVKIKGKHFSFYIQSYWKVFQEDKMPPATTIFGATAQAAALTGISESMEYYQETITHYITKNSEILEFKHMVLLHEKTATEALDIFKKIAVLGDENFRLKYSNKLNKDIQTLFMLYLGKNEAKKAQDLTNTIDNLSLEINEYKSKTSAQGALMELLNNQLEKYRTASTEEKGKLIDEMTSLRREFKNTTEQIILVNEKEKQQIVDEINKLKAKEEQTRLANEIEKLKIIELRALLAEEKQTSINALFVLEELENLRKKKEEEVKLENLRKKKEEVKLENLRKKKEESECTIL